MDRLHYEEYRDVLSVINRRTFSAFIKLYDEGPIKVKSVKRHKLIDELITGGFVQKYWDQEACEYMYGTTVIGQRIFEAVADVCDGVGMGSVVRYGQGEDV